MLSSKEEKSATGEGGSECGLYGNICLGRGQLGMPLGRFLLVGICFSK